MGIKFAKKDKNHALLSRALAQSSVIYYLKESLFKYANEKLKSGYLIGKSAGSMYWASICFARYALYTQMAGVNAEKSLVLLQESMNFALSCRNDSVIDSLVPHLIGNAMYCGLFFYIFFSE